LLVVVRHEGAEVVLVQAAQQSVRAGRLVLAQRREGREVLLVLALDLPQLLVAASLGKPMARSDFNVKALVEQSGDNKSGLCAAKEG
jgi:hypothetical protein